MITLPDENEGTDLRCNEKNKIRSFSVFSVLSVVRMVNTGIHGF